MQKLLSLTLSLLSLGCFTALPVQAVATEVLPSAQVVTSVPASKEMHILFVIRAAHAVIAQSNDGYILTLNGVDPKTLWFADRPFRKAGLMPISKLMSDWEKAGSSFQVTPPNAAIVYKTIAKDKNGVQLALPVELSHPQTLSDNAWQFKLTDLSGQASLGNYDEVDLFIDSAGSFFFDLASTYVEVNQLDPGMNTGGE